MLLDDRGERPGVMFADLELIGIPHRITIGERGLKDGNVEYQPRRATTEGPGPTAVPVAEIDAFIRRKAFGMTFLGTWVRLAAILALVAIALSPLAARAGAQVEERLAPSVVTVLSGAISDRPVPLRLRLAAGPAAVDGRDVAPPRGQGHRRPHARGVPGDRPLRATRAGLDPQLVLGVIQYESAFRKYAISTAGARGYMQVMPFWTALIGGGETTISSTCARTCATGA